MSQILIQFLYAGALVGATFMVHAVAIVIVRMVIRKPGEGKKALGNIAHDTFRLIAIGLWFFAVHCVSVWMWAGLYYFLGVCGTVESALYFAMTTYTTLGFGDVLAAEEWRLLTGAAAMSGLLLFGISAAILVESAEHLRYRQRV